MNKQPIGTPICDFVRGYAASDTVRLHMPGHKGRALLGPEMLDITEIEGADSLYEAEGIIAASEQNAGALFGANSFYSTEGSSQCIRAMLYLATLHARARGLTRAHVLAGRNAHKTFVGALALLDADVTWLTEGESYLTCAVTPERVEQRLRESGADTLYLTSPDYLGNTVDIAAIAAVCRRLGVLFLVDNAHGAYLKFLSPSRHPMDLGADICCDSAHKTLPVLTGGAYLHLSHAAPAELVGQARRALSMFGSTSPSYLILQSLDAVNPLLGGDYPAALAATAARVLALREALTRRGYRCTGDEPIKLTLTPRSYGYTGTELAAYLRRGGVECEFADPDHLVLMFTPATAKEDFDRLQALLTDLPRREPSLGGPPPMTLPERVMSVRDAALSASETVKIADSVGRVLAAATVGCPPAVPIVVSGERIDSRAAALFAYYRIDTCEVVK